MSVRPANYFLNQEYTVKEAPSSGLNIAVVIAPPWAFTSRLSSAVSDRREQHERDCNEVEGALIDFDESEALPLCVLQQSPPLPLIGQ